MIMTINDACDGAKKYRVTEKEAEIIKKFLSLTPGHEEKEIGDILYDHDVTIEFKIIDF